jgi:hypothetical protein
MTPITLISASNGSTGAIEPFAGTTRGFDVAIRSIGCIARVRIDVRARRRAISSNPTLSHRLFVLLEQRNMIGSGGDVPIFPTKERREVIEYRQRQFSQRICHREAICK